MSANLKKDHQFIWHPYTQMSAADHICIVKGEGAYLFDERGNKYIDIVSSWWTNLHGHAHPHIVQKIAAQASQLEHVIFAGFTHPTAIELGERLLNHLPANQKKIFFSDDGSTAVEVALKMAIQFWNNQAEKRTNVIAFKNGYHGDTFGAMSIGERGIFNQPFHDLLFDVIFIDAPISGNETASLQQLQFAINNDSSSIACFIFEPLVQGAGGMLMHDPEALNELVSICKQHHILTIADEVMTGFGRTGKFFACDYLSQKPDIFCLSKGLTGGFLPMSVTTCTEEIFNAFLSEKNAAFNKTFYHGHSYTANPLGCAAALASLDLMEETTTQKNIQRIVSKHATFRKQIAVNPKVLEARQCGTILAIELQTPEGSSYTSEVRDTIYNFFMSRGIIMRPLGNTLYLMPPYCIPDTDLDYIYSSIKDFLK
ncbi:MAG: adenosylmethionine--8-amino-7-oxononanoate transaminase [Chitinophagales bacterium]